MKKLIKWLGMSNRWKHLIGGLIIGIFAFGWFTAMYDFGLTVAGAMIGQLIEGTLIWNN